MQKNLRAITRIVVDDLNQILEMKISNDKPSTTVISALRHKVVREVKL